MYVSCTYVQVHCIIYIYIHTLYIHIHIHTYLHFSICMYMNMLYILYMYICIYICITAFSEAGEAMPQTHKGSQTRSSRGFLSLFATLSFDFSFSAYKPRAMLIVIVTSNDCLTA